MRDERWSKGFHHPFPITHHHMAHFNPKFLLNFDNI